MVVPCAATVRMVVVMLANLTVLVVMMVIVVRVIVVLVVIVLHGHRLRCLSVLNQAELRRRDARTQHAIDADFSILDGQAAERGTQAVEWQTEIEQRAEHHVARRSGEAIEVRRSCHSDEPFLTQAAIPDVREDDVIDHVDSHQHARRHHPLGQLDIVGARFRIP
jgi:hypothetical protein